MSTEKEVALEETPPQTDAFNTDIEIVAERVLIYALFNLHLCRLQKSGIFLQVSKAVVYFLVSVHTNLNWSYFISLKTCHWVLSTVRSPSVYSVKVKQ